MVCCSARRSSLLFPENNDMQEGRPTKMRKRTWCDPFGNLGSVELPTIHRLWRVSIDIKAAP